MPKKDAFEIYQDRKVSNIERMKKSNKLVTNNKNRQPLKSINVNKQVSQQIKSKQQIPTTQLNTKQLLHNIQKDESKKTDKESKLIEINPKELTFKSLENNRGFLPRFNSIDEKLNCTIIKTPEVSHFQDLLKQVVSWFKLNRYQYNIKEEMINTSEEKLSRPSGVNAGNEVDIDSADLIHSLLSSSNNNFTDKINFSNIYKIINIQDLSDMLTIATVTMDNDEVLEKRIGLIKIYDIKLIVGQRICLDQINEKDAITGNFTTMQLSNGEKINVYIKWKVLDK
ncbi:hypothetical protein KGF54_001305 [Candida jiufengensis]|uniref:uncharacterized protein n=1 Tax=Candida jiufengensis TaxID=497108 RepID=UPI0022251D54|nr:uncharacterized protein KGF54_001305 [Candida jiufengensis]KAI5955803.1 hypothetical protein KGF54_001305 [Candida jiufengensis]